MMGHPFIHIHNATLPLSRTYIHLELKSQMLFLVYLGPRPSQISPVLNVEFEDT